MKNRETLCPNIEDHTHQPDGYIAWHDWALEMSKTHKQRQCAGCGLYNIWELKTFQATQARLEEAENKLKRAHDHSIAQDNRQADDEEFQMQMHGYRGQD